MTTFANRAAKSENNISDLRAADIVSPFGSSVSSTASILSADSFRSPIFDINNDETPMRRGSLRDRGATVFGSPQPVEDDLYLQPSEFASEEIVYIRSRLSSYFLTAKSNGSIVVGKFRGTLKQQWAIRQGSIVCVANKKCLDINSTIFAKYVVLRPADAKRPSQRFRFEDNKFFSEDTSHSKYCIDILGASKSKGASAVMHPEKKKKGAQSSVPNQLWDVIPKGNKEIAVLDQYSCLSNMGGYNQSKCLELEGKKIFFKPHKSEKSILLEIGGCKLTSFLTESLVPPSYRATYKGVMGICQPYYEMDTTPFRKLKSDKHYVVDLTFLNSNQAHQLFIHMIADRLISNWDTHNEQFAIDNKGNVISYDKEKCYYLFEMKNVDVLASVGMKEDYRKFDLHLNLWKSPMIMATQHNLFFIYSSLVVAIFSGKIKIDPNHKVIQDFLGRCERVTPELIRDCFADYALLKYMNNYAETFLTITYKRIRNIRKPLYYYFGWEGQFPPTAENEPWILSKHPSLK